MATAVITPVRCGFCSCWVSGWIRIPKYTSINQMIRHKGSDGIPSLSGARVIIVIGPLELGGAERQALLFARYLKETEHANVHVWGTMGEPGRVATLCDEMAIPWRIVPQPWPIEARQLARLTWQLRQARPDIILPYMWRPSILCNLVWRGTGARLCIW